MEKSIDELSVDIAQWHIDRRITINGNAVTQTAKLGEEFGELCSGVVRDDIALIKDSIGDMYVVMIAIAELSGITIQECIESAYEEIKDRKGYLNELGNFVKEGDK